MSNHLKHQTSPYLLQHAENPVDWYPWCEEAFARAKTENKPVFLSIGYSTCHWCHVMAHESFEDPQIAELLNRYFISIKVDKEERPDIDSIYMSVCQTLTGSGGWPMSVFLTPEQKPFFAGTYYPKTARYGQPGFGELLLAIHDKWEKERERLLVSADGVLAFLETKSQTGQVVAGETSAAEEASVAGETAAGNALIASAVRLYKQSFDLEYGGFGSAPKFPIPHNLLFLMQYYEKSKDASALFMAEKTLQQMYLGGIFDQIGGGFSRYSTDRQFLVPHFEKMLYDNALLILAYAKAYQLTGKQLYGEAAKRTASYVLREMTAPDGGFYSAQDADSEGVEGKYYLFTPEEITEILGKTEGKKFSLQFDITERGNFEGKNIPNRLNTAKAGADAVLLPEETVREWFPKVYEYRKSRYSLQLDDKILTSWNGLMIAAMCSLYRVTGNRRYLQAAVAAQKFLLEKLCEGDKLYLSWRAGKRSGAGLLDDYAFEIFALLALYGATFFDGYLELAERFCKKAVTDFSDEVNGGFFLSGTENERLISRPKESYDGAVFSGNSAMACNLVQLWFLTGKEEYRILAERQLEFMKKEAGGYPAGYAMFLTALSDFLDPPEKVTVVLKETNADAEEKRQELAKKLPLGTLVRVLNSPAEGYPLKNGETTYYVCCGQRCLPPMNELEI